MVQIMENCKSSSGEKSKDRILLGVRLGSYFLKPLRSTELTSWFAGQSKNACVKVSGVST